MGRIAFICTVCKLFKGRNYKAVFQHTRTHRFEPGLSIKCGINSCSEKYTNYESFRSHVYRKHEEVLNICKDTHNHGSREDEHIIEIPLAKDGP